VKEIVHKAKARIRRGSLAMIERVVCELFFFFDNCVCAVGVSSVLCGDPCTKGHTQILTGKIM